MHPNAPLIKRNGEVNAWDNEDFRAAVRATGKKQVIMGGIVTDVRITKENSGIELTLSQLNLRYALRS